MAAESCSHSQHTSDQFTLRIRHQSGSECSRLVGEDSWPRLTHTPFGVTQKLIPPNTVGAWCGNTKRLRILCMVAKQGANVLFCMPRTTEWIL
jgi:hypothetical protein